MGDMRQKVPMGVSQKVPSPLVGEGRRSVEQGPVYGMRP